MSYQVKSKIPVWGEDAKPGYLFFTFTDRSFISLGIAYFSKWDALSDIYVSHVGLVGRTAWKGVHSTAPGGVQEADLTEYFRNPKVHIFFRKPRGWSEDLGIRTLKSAEKRIGHKYGYTMIAAHALTNTLLGRFLNVALFGLPMQAVGRVLDDPAQEVCSELVAISMKEQPEYNKRGVLVKPAFMLKPQDLFECPVLLEPMKKG